MKQEELGLGDLSGNAPKVEELKSVITKSLPLKRPSGCGPVGRVELTPRDFDVLRFIIEMKFSSSREVFEKFFRVRLSNEEATTDSFAKKRLLKLEKSGFLRSTYTFSEAAKYYVATYKAFRALSEFAPSLDLGKPTVGFDIRTFIHDKLVLESRLKLERELGVCDWVSDRMLKAGAASNYGFSAAFVPDAVYELPSGERVVFELEIAQKGRAKYVEKIRHYVELMRDRRADRKSFERVHYLCFRKQPFEILKSETRIYGELFNVERGELL